MNARLPSGETRIEVARRAIKEVAAKAPADTRLALRMYGSQSPRAEKNCQDTHLALPFGSAESQSGPIAASVDAALAQDYTPIALSLEQAQNDFPGDVEERVIVLVSDGKETCQGDPCAVAKAMSENGYAVHAVGFVVDSAARMQPLSRPSTRHGDSRGPLTLGALPGVPAEGAGRD